MKDFFPFSFFRDPSNITLPWSCLLLLFDSEKLLSLSKHSLSISAYLYVLTSFGLLALCYHPFSLRRVRVRNVFHTLSLSCLQIELMLHPSLLSSESIYCKLLIISFWDMLVGIFTQKLYFSFPFIPFLGDSYPIFGYNFVMKWGICWALSDLIFYFLIVIDFLMFL